MSYEQRDASLVVIGVSAGLLALCVVISIVVSLWLYHRRYTSPDVAATVPRQTTFAHGDTERTGISRDYEAVNADAMGHLHGYGWVDRNAGIARIPIERALDLMAAGAKPAPAPDSEKKPGEKP